MEAGFKLDTSGTVYGVGPDDRIRFPDLSPFEQGYVEAMFAAFWEDENARRHEPGYIGSKHTSAEADYGFSDLAPDTLAAIRKDCAAYQQSEMAELCNAAEGRWFWGARNLRDDMEPFGPLLPHLGDDGLVRLREV